MAMIPPQHWPLQSVKSPATARDGILDVDHLCAVDLVTLVALFFLYMNVPAVAVRFHGVPQSFAAAVGTLFVVAPIYYLLVRRGPLMIDRVTWFGLAFIGVQALSAAFSSDPERATGPVFTSLVEGFVLYVLLLNSIRSPATLRAATWTLLSVGTLLGALSLIQWEMRDFRNNYAGFAQVGIALPLDASPYENHIDERRASGPIGEVNRYAQIMLMLVPLAFFRFLSKQSIILRTAGLAATGFTTVGAMLSFSRGAAVGFALLAILMLLLRYISPRQFGLLALVVFVLVMMSDTYRERLLTLADLEQLNDANPDEEVDTSLQGRFTENKAAALMYVEHAIIGVGPGLYAANYIEYAQRVGGRVHQEEREPHSLYLGIAAELGTLGLMVYLAMVVTALSSLARARRLCRSPSPDLSHYSAAYMLALIAYLATGLFLHLSYVRYFWMMLALGGAASRIALTAGRKASSGNSQAIRSC